MDKLSDRIGSTSVADQIEALFTNSKTLKQEEDRSGEVKLSEKEGNILSVDQDGGLYAKPEDGIDYSITVAKADPHEEGIATRYTITQANKEEAVGTIDIPADMVISDAKIENITDYNKEGETRPGVTQNGTYLVLTIANAEKKELYVLMDRFFDAYTGGETSDISVSVDGQKKITATIVEGAIGEGKLADSAVSTGKLANGAVTLEKLDSAVTQKFSLVWEDFPVET